MAKTEAIRKPRKVITRDSELQSILYPWFEDHS